MGNVVVLPVKPKTLKRQYKRQHYTVTFIPATKKWKWAVTIVRELKFEEEADTQIKAFKAAERFIDQHVSSEKVS